MLDSLSKSAVRQAASRTAVMTSVALGFVAGALTGWVGASPITPSTKRGPLLVDLQKTKPTHSVFLSHVND